MTQPVTSLAEWRTFRSKLRLRLRAHLGQSLGKVLRTDAWSPSEVFHHVLLVDASTADLLDRLVTKAGPRPQRNADEPWPVRPELMDFPLDTAFSVPAFRGTEPKRGVSVRTLDALEKTVNARYEGLATLASTLQLDEVSFPHPLAGKLNFYEWLVFGGVHEGLHLIQLERDLSS